jgi:hypothetical protein
MPIAFACEHCGQKLTVSTSRAGQRGKCPKCRQPIVVPTPRDAAPAETPADAAKPSTASVKTPPAAAKSSPVATSSATVEPATVTPPAAAAPPPVVREQAPATTAELQVAAPAAATVAVDGGAAAPDAGRPPAEPPSPPGPLAPPPPPEPEVVAPPPAAEAAAPDSDDALPEWIAQSPREESPWIYVDTTAEAKAEPAVARNIDLSRVSLPRYVIFAQGVALGVVGLVAFALGLLAGGGDRSAGVGPAGAGTPCVVSGAVEHVTSGGTKFSDEGAVVIVFPQDQRPAADERAVADGLRPDDPAPSAAVPALKMLQLMGAVYARTDVAGQFRVSLPRGGSYYVLVVSHHASRRQGREISRGDLAALGRYILSPGELIRDRRYRWRAEDFQRDTELNVVLD